MGSEGLEDMKRHTVGLHSFISEFSSFWSSCESLSFFISLYSTQSSANRRIDEWILFGKSLI